MDNRIMDALAPDGYDEGRWTINNDGSADWAIRKIKEIEADIDRQVEVVKEEMSRMELLKEELEKEKESKTAYFRGKLMEYFETVKVKETKTQKSYALPSGKLIRKAGTYDYIKDEDMMLAWLKENKPELVKVKESADWAGFKAQLTVMPDGEVVTEDGEILEFVKAEKKPDKFEIK